MSSPPSLSSEDLHARYTEQARWTASLRRQLLEAPSIRSARRVLEVGSGTGAITEDLARTITGKVIGLDIDLRVTAFASAQGGDSNYLVADGADLPFTRGSFDLCVCHFLLLWVEDPAHILREMARVTSVGGSVAILAEPDYGGRIDHPPSLAELGALQTSALRARGANVHIGRTLGELLIQADLESVRVGVLGGEWGPGASTLDTASEWVTLRADLEAWLPADELSRYQEADAAAWRDGNRILFVPTFYATGRVP